MEDWTDHHVRRWRNHWIDVSFDDEVEGVAVRIGRLARHLHRIKQEALVETGLQDFEYDTLHTLMIRETPGRASPTDLARDLGVSGAGMTGRLDGLENRGWIQRLPSTEDRRRVDIEITKSGAEIWRHAMGVRGTGEKAMIGVLSRKEQASLNRLLKKLTLAIRDE